jgi:hypothetical protein
MRFLFHINQTDLPKANVTAGFCFVMTGAATLFLAVASLMAEEPPASGSDFTESIRRIFTDDQMADFRVSFGYDNTTDLNAPSDPVRARNLINYLASNSFTPVKPDEALAAKLGVPLEAQNLRIFDGPGFQGQTLRISLIWSSATSSTAKNIGSEYARQLIYSNEALKFMQKAASDAEVMAYLGHSRAGGGPDTFPPVTLNNVRGERQQVDLSYYGNAQPGLEALGPCFSQARERPHIIAWTSCATDRHFREWLSQRLARKTHATSLLLSTRLTNHIPGKDKIEGCDEGLMVVVRLIEALQKHESRADFEQDLLTCEMEEFRDMRKPAWKLISLPGAGESRPVARKTVGN